MILLALLLVVLMAAPPPGAAASGEKDVTATLFQTSFDSVARECRDVLGPAGYGWVQISPVHEHVAGPEWWTVYQPVRYRVAGRLGGEDAFRRMLGACHGAGVKVMVDAVVNHMTAGTGTGTGTGGSAYTKYDYPGLYGDEDFHACRSGIDDYSDRRQVQECELVGLADLDTGAEGVRAAVAGWLDRLVALGVDGFRIDAAKHAAASDLAAVQARMEGPSAYWVQEVGVAPEPADRPDEAVQPREYLGVGDVDEFGAAYDLARIFTAGKLADLRGWGDPSRGYLPSDRARTFVDNWDTERAGSTLTVADGAAYLLANVFVLAWPYGSPNVYSGYEFSHRDQGPPPPGDGWTRWHADPRVTAMVAFRRAVGGRAVTDWWDDGGDAVAFGRGDQGFVVLNHQDVPLTRTFQTSLPAGFHRDVLGSGRYAVDGRGRFDATVGPGEAIALLAVRSG